LEEFARGFRFPVEVEFGLSSADRWSVGENDLVVGRLVEGLCT